MWPLFELGRWDELLETACAVAEWDREHGPTQVAMLARPYEAHVRFLRGEVDEAATLMEEVLDRAREMQDPQVYLPALMAAAEVAYARRGSDAALALVREFERATVGRGFWRATYCPDLVRIAVACADLELAGALLEDVRAPGRRQELAVTSGRGAVAEARGDVVGAAAYYAEAGTGWSEYGFVYEEALARQGEGRCRYRVGDQSAAERLLAAARETLGELRVAPSALLAADPS